MESGRIADLGRARWGGERHRLEVWYATFTDAASGDGYWLHHEVVAPVDADARPYAHGWLSVFPTDGAPNTHRFGPSPPGDKGWFSAGDVLVEDGTVAAVGGDAASPGATILECDGLVVAPGLVDIHVHLREPGREDKETVETGSRAAALGGFTAVAAMANTETVADSLSVIDAATDTVIATLPLGTHPAAVAVAIVPSK